ncbi:MAG: hypothetical protein JOZ15_13580 [Acidobacteria bacterium]|nr:hypothetical protein [Acidobacteriota bacterium]
MNTARMLVPSLFIVLCCAPIEVGAVAVPPPEVPLVHFTSTDTFCALVFPGIPGQQVCINLAFADTDLWVFRDKTAWTTLAYEAAGFPPAQVKPTPLAAAGERGRVPSVQFANLQAALAAVPIGTAEGECNPVPPLVGVPPNFPQTVLHARIVWYGRGLRTNILELGTYFPTPCPQPLVDLVTLLLGLPPSIVPSPGQ